VDLTADDGRSPGGCRDELQIEPWRHGVQALGTFIQVAFGTSPAAAEVVDAPRRRLPIDLQLDPTPRSDRHGPTPRDLPTTPDHRRSPQDLSQILDTSLGVPVPGVTDGSSPSTSKLRCRVRRRAAPGPRPSAGRATGASSPRLAPPGRLDRTSSRSRPRCTPCCATRSAPCDAHRRTRRSLTGLGLAGLTGLTGLTDPVPGRRIVQTHLASDLGDPAARRLDHRDELGFELRGELRRDRSVPLLVDMNTPVGSRTK